MADGEGLSTEGFVSIEQGAPEPQAPEAKDAVIEHEAGDPPADEPNEGQSDDADPPADSEQPRKKTVQDRIDEVTRARREAEREAKYWRDVAEGRTRPQNQQDRQQPEEAKAPDPDDYDMGETDPAYIRAVINHEVRKGLDEAKSGMAQDLQVQAQERVWETAQEAARSKFDDYDEVVQTHDPVTGAPKWPCSREMAQAIRTSDVGGEVAYHLASNPEEARRIASLDPISQIRELGRLEARLDSSVAPKPQPKTATDAPKPPENMARGAGGKFSVAPDTDDFAAFEKTYGSAMTVR